MLCTVWQNIPRLFSNLCVITQGVDLLVSGSSEQAQGVWFDCYPEAFLSSNSCVGSMTTHCLHNDTPMVHGKGLHMKTMD